jgi:hypothetical protein
MVTELESMLALAERSQGWNFREYPPQRMRLRGNCELIVVPPWLWRPRVGPRPRPVCAPIPFRKVG